MSSYSAIITGTGSYVPEKRLTNDELSRIVETDNDWIVQRTGIYERRVVAKDESCATIASHAATQALRAARKEPKDLDCVIVATVTPEMQMPATACFVAKSLGLDRTPAWDLNAACSGWLYGLDVATAYIQAGRYRNVMVIGSETLTRITDYTDRSSCILFGDGAGAAVISREESPGSGRQRRGVLYSSLYADGAGWETLYLMPGSRHPIDERMIAARNQFLKIRGRDVYRFAVTRFIEMIDDAMKRCELTPKDVKLVVPHQVNQRIIDSAMEKLGFSPEKAYTNLDRYGNTSSASIPIALDEAVREGKLSSGDVVVMVAFGAGLTWANAVVRM